MVFEIGNSTVIINWNELVLIIDCFPLLFFQWQYPISNVQYSWITVIYTIPTNKSIWSNQGLLAVTDLQVIEIISKKSKQYFIQIIN